MLTLRVAKWVRPNGLACQPVLKGMGWVEDFNPSAVLARPV